MFSTVNLRRECAALQAENKRVRRECAALQAENKRVREQLGLYRLATAMEVAKHAETLEHLRLMSRDNERLEGECELWRAFWRMSTPDMPGLTDNSGD